MTTVPLEKNNGPALAAIVAAGFGVGVLGLCVLFAEVRAAISDALNWWPPVGPLFGKTGIAVIAWLVTWGALHLAWRRRDLSFRVWWAVALGLILIGVLLTFPPIFQLPRGH
jgi:H+/Cl- antiporter ClcA